MMAAQRRAEIYPFPMGKRKTKMKRTAANIVKKFITNSRCTLLASELS
jgi:hypothetical protein